MRERENEREGKREKECVCKKRSTERGLERVSIGDSEEKRINRSCHII